MIFILVRCSTSFIDTPVLERGIPFKLNLLRSEKYVRAHGVEHWREFSGI